MPRARKRRPRQAYYSPKLKKSYLSPSPLREGARSWGRVGRRRLLEEGLTTPFRARPVLRRQELPPIFTRLARGGVSVRSPQYDVPTRGGFRRRPHSSVVYLQSNTDPCTRQSDRRRVMFAAGNAGAKWGSGKGPFPASMRNKVFHGCKR